MRRTIGSAARVVAMALYGCMIASGARAETCPTAGVQPAVLAGVEPRLELRLSDGRLVRLAGIEAPAPTPSDPARAEEARDALLASLKGRALSIAPLGERPDRWGRIVAFAFTADAVMPGGIATTVLASGLARYRPEPAAAACRTELNAAEDAARRGRLGLWRDPYYSVLAVDDRAAFAERAGTNVLVEARLVAVEPGPYRTRLRFAAAGSRGGRRLEATIARRAMKTFEAQGVDFSSLIGRTLRLRGLLDQRFGPRIELSRPDEVEVLSKDPAASDVPPSARPR